VNRSRHTSRDASASNRRVAVVQSDEQEQAVMLVEKWESLRPSIRERRLSSLNLVLQSQVRRQLLMMQHPDFRVNR
jgi:hypothetical protein